MTTATDRRPPTERRRPGMLRPVGSGDGLAFSVAAIVIVVAFGALVAKTGAMTRVDLRGDVLLTRWHTGAVGALGSAVYRIFSPAEAIVLTAAVVVVIALVTRHLRLAATFAVVVAGTWVPSAVVKILVDRARPDTAALSHHLTTMPTDPSYPSGHMVFVTSLALAFVFLAHGTRRRPIAIAVGIVAVAVVGLCLVSDGVHYPSDVLASIVWSLGVAPLVLAVCNRIAPERGGRVGRRDAIGGR